MATQLDSVQLDAGDTEIEPLVARSLADNERVSDNEGVADGRAGYTTYIGARHRPVFPHRRQAQASQQAAGEGHAPGSIDHRQSLGEGV